MLPPLPRCSGWAYSSLISPGRISLPRKGCRVGLHIVLFEACSAFTRVAACTLARSPIRDPLPEGFRHFVSSMPAPVASGWSESPGGACTHWKAPPCHGAHPFETFMTDTVGDGARPHRAAIDPRPRRRGDRVRQPNSRFGGCAVTRRRFPVGARPTRRFAPAGSNRSRHAAPRSDR